MYTITKDDMRRVIDLTFPKGWGGHNLDVYEDLVGMFVYGKEYTLEEVFRPFDVDLPYAQALAPKKRYALTEIAVFKDGRVLAGTKVEKYADYLYPLFYIALVTKYGSFNASRDVAGRIFNDYPTFEMNRSYKDGKDEFMIKWYGENYLDWRYRWIKTEGQIAHHFTLSEEEHKESDEMYNLYLRVKFFLEG